MFALSLKYLWGIYYDRQADPTSDKPLPPGNMGWPLLGETVHFVIKGCKFYTEKMVKYGKIYKTHIMGKPSIRVMAAENVKKILIGENVLVQTSWPTTLRKLFVRDRSLSAQTGDDHRTRKVTISKVLGPENLSYMVPEFQKVIRECIENWCNQDQVFGSFICRQMTYRLTNEVIVGVDINDTQSIQILPYFETMIDNAFSIPIKCPGLAFKQAVHAKDKIIVAIKELIAQSNNNSSSDVNCVLDVLRNLRDADSLTDDDMVDLLLELMFAGHHTTASVCCSLLLHLGQSPEVLEKIREELLENEILDPTANLTFEQINKLPYIDNVFKEILLVKPPVGGAFRKALKTFEVGGYQIPKDWTVIYSIRETHNISPMFENPHKFNPERWNGERLKSADLRFHYIPFGLGARSCPGEQFAKLTVKIFLVEMARRCNWKLHNKNPDIDLLPSPYPKDKLPVSFTKLEIK
ncbi:hypothetical protein LOTGIDRAFT_111029 [Lottia gigantea]|uniref:Uncharacterized protein n=1 Tax=Lottia gigantea TaxID=225164 RepID=V4AFL4_LOTGI|nr:hypothetical protein LOTGIDRAFT_111029 [Lottia gigantea]ESP02824.1 hypothetical protein LOTGIDRAFT_111029 [Lottia gigantea]